MLTYNGILLTDDYFLNTVATLEHYKEDLSHGEKQEERIRRGE